MTRIALLGIIHESNANAPHTSKADFEAYYLGVGVHCLDRFLNSEPRGFCQRFSELRNWTPIPILLALAEPAGPVEDALVFELTTLIESELVSHGPVDGVFIFGHGAGVTASGEDLDAVYISRVREIVGPSVPIVVEIDPHADASTRMLNAADIYVAYRTNPHVDIDKRGRDCAKLLNELLSGARFAAFSLRLPMVLPQPSQLTTRGEPFHDAWRRISETVLDDTIADLSILTGCSFADRPYSGVTILCYSRRSLAHAESAARRAADIIWEMRAGFVRIYKSPEEGALLAKDAVGDGTSIVLADVADNPGGGGTGNTLWLLDALLRVGASECCFGIVHDPDVVVDAIDAGVGNTFKACFNRSSSSLFSLPAVLEARVIAVRSGVFVENAGMLEGIEMDLGPRVALLIEGVYVAVSSIRHQCLSPQYFLECGIPCNEINAWVVKSRGHFRAGFSAIAQASNIYEVVAPGLTSPDLNTLGWRHTPRPCFPLDCDTPYAPTVVHARER